MNLLIVDDDYDIRESIKRILEFEGFQVVAAENGLSAQRLLENDVFEMMVLDLNMPGMDGLTLLRWLRDYGPNIPVLMISAHNDVTQAVEAMRLGAHDYLVKPFDSDELVFRIRHILDYEQTRTRLHVGFQKSFPSHEILGVSPAVQAIMTLIQKVAPTPSTVLLTGESGTGKEVIANVIHKQSLRATKPLIAVNIGGVPENLLESELFGYEKGAFTGAAARKIGMFELASGGTLLLDEIGDMPLHLQVKLLRVLQERKIQRLGGTHSLPIDVRILAATNTPIEQQVRDGTFREDFFYRLNVFRIHLPPLRERPEDIPLLAGVFLQKFAQLIGKAVTGITPEALVALQQYAFPGNIRELENMIERAVILANTTTLTNKDLGLPAAPSRAPVKRGTLVEIEKQAIRDALHRWEGRRNEAAHELGISRKTLFNKIKRYHLDAEG